MAEAARMPARVGMGPVGGVRLFRGDADGMTHGLVLGHG